MLFCPPDHFIGRFAAYSYFSSQKRKAVPQMAAMVIAVAFGGSLASRAATPGGATASTNGSTQAAETSYYLTQRIPVTTDAGIRSLDIGTEVMLVKRGKNGIVVRLLDGTELVVSPGQLTHDASRAQQLADQEREKAAAAAESARAQAEAKTSAEAARREREVSAAEDYVRRAQNAALAASAEPAATSRPWGLTGSALDEKPKVVAKVNVPKKNKK